MEDEYQSFVEKHQLLGCIQCGRCTGGCPVASGTALNIRSLLYTASREEQIDALAKLPEIWECTACHTCAIRCPKGLKPLEVLFGLRTLLIEEGRIQKTVQDALESLFREGNPWARSRATRHDWMKDEDISVYQGEKVANLIFVCCTIAYDPGVMVLAKNLSWILKTAQVSHAFLGEGESCCGSEVISLGEDCLFEEILEENTPCLNQVKAQRIITISPHCFVTFKEDYPDLHREVWHYTQLLASLPQEDLNPPRLEKRVIYHDPCYLGKQGGIFHAPRQILSAMEGITLLEFDQAQERSLCCGGGGGKMWLESAVEGQRLAEKKITEAHEKGAQLVISACPFCLLTLEDAVKTLNLEEELQVLELLELWGERDGQ